MQDNKQKTVEGLLWGEGTICNVKWGGFLLRDIISQAQVLKQATPGQLFLCFASHVTACENDDWFGASIPLQRAMDEHGDPLLAYEVRRKGLPYIFAFGQFLY